MPGKLAEILNNNKNGQAVTTTASGENARFKTESDCRPAKVTATPRSSAITIPEELKTSNQPQGGFWCSFFLEDMENTSETANVHTVVT